MITPRAHARFSRWCRAARVIAVALLLQFPVTADAADTWVEIAAPHFTVLANGNARDARTLAWQLEQIRSTLVKIMPWARVDLDRPFTVLAVNSEQKMRALVPEYWERSRGIKPASVWVAGGDQYYLAIRSDMQVEDRLNINPHINAYFSYVAVIVQQSLERAMPLWFTRGLAGVLSNTIVRESFVKVGAPIPWHLEELRQRGRLRLSQLIAVAPGSSEIASNEGFSRFDAQSWAFVHFLMFADKGARAAKLNQFLQLVNAGTAPDVAMAESIGKVEQLETEFLGYLERQLYSFAQLEIDTTVRRERFPERVLPPTVAASTLALFYAATGRPVEARVAIAEARTSGAPVPETYVAEALLLSREAKVEDARAALTRAVADGSTSAYAHYELARLQWEATDRETLLKREKLLTRATELNPRHAWAFAMLAEVRSQLGASDALETAARAIRLEPSESAHRLIAASVLFRSGQRADALKAIEAALTLAVNEQQRTRAVELQRLIERSKPQFQYE